MTTRDESAMRSPFSRRSRAPWSFRDFFDLEYLLQQDAPLDLATRTSRDREIGAAWLSREGRGSLQACPDAELLHFWIAQRRQQLRTDGQAPAETPGQRLGAALRTVFALLALTVMGLSVTSMVALLQSSAQAPINIWRPLLLYVGAPLALSALVGLYLLGLSWRDPDFPGLLTPPLRRLLQWLATPRPPDPLRPVFGLRHLEWERLFPLFRRLSVLFFSLLALLYLLSADLTLLLGAKLIHTRWGWETTSWSPEEVHAFVSGYSYWQPLVSHGAPSLGEIADSRIWPDPSPRAATHAGRYLWWPHLAWTILFWGVLPRTLLALWVYRSYRTGLARFDFDYGDCQALLFRLRDPGAGFSHEERATAPPPTPAPHPPAPDPGALPTPARLVLLVPEGIYHPTDEARYSACLQQRLQPKTLEIHPVSSVRREEVRNLLQTMAASGFFDRGGGLVHLQRAYRPFTESHHKLFQEVRALLGPQPPCLVWLVGRPDGRDNLTAPAREDLLDWQTKLQELGDPLTRTFTTGGNDDPA